MGTVMFSKKIDRLMQKVPAIRDVYIANYSRSRRMLYSVNRLIPIVRTPICVHWHSTYACNFRCGHCGAEGGAREVETVSTKQILGAVQDMGRMGVNTFIVTGGEPLLRDDLFDVLDFARKAGITHRSLATNSYLVDQYRDRLAEQNLGSVHLSLDGLAETNDTLRGMPGAFLKTMDALRFFKEINVKERVVNTVVFNNNLDELEKLLEMVMDASVTLWSLVTPFDVGRAKDNAGLQLDDDGIVRLFRFMLEARKYLPVKLGGHVGFLGPLERLLRPRPFFCGGGLETCTILGNGDVVGCQQLYDTELSMGNIKERSFSAIWKQGHGQFKMPEPPDSCRSCEYFPACYGGCGALWQVEGRCLKHLWSLPEFAGLA